MSENPMNRDFGASAQGKVALGGQMGYGHISLPFLYL